MPSNNPLLCLNTPGSVTGPDTSAGLSSKTDPIAQSYQPSQTFLTLPGEIRNEIYSYCAPSNGPILGEDVRKRVYIYCLIHGVPAHTRCLWCKGDRALPEGRPKCKKFEQQVAALIEQETAIARALMLVNKQVSEEFLGWLYANAQWYGLAGHQGIRDINEINFWSRLRHVTIAMPSDWVPNLRLGSQIRQGNGEGIPDLPQHLQWFKDNDKSLQTMTLVKVTHPEPSSHTRPTFRRWIDGLVKPTADGGQVKAWKHFELAGSGEYPRLHICCKIEYAVPPTTAEVVTADPESV